MIITVLTIIVAFFFSLFSTAVISYVAMATPIGPWMEMTLVLLGTLLVKTVFHAVSLVAQMRMVAYATVAGGIAGAIAIACAFSFPTLYFLEPSLFTAWLAQPGYFCLFLGSLVLAAGGVGLLLASFFERRMFADSSMVFPIGQMVYNMIAVQVQLHEAWQLIWGVVAALCYGILETITGLIPAQLVLFGGAYSGIFILPSIIIRNTQMIPMFWAIGFTTGHMVTVPLLVAIMTKGMLIDPIHSYFFSSLSTINYLLAFGSGMAIYGAIMSFSDLPSLFKGIPSRWQRLHTTPLHLPKELKPSVMASLMFLVIAFLWYCHFTLAAQMYLLFFTMICVYQLLIIAGKIGIAPLGRFATFVMVPGLLLFGYTAVQATVVAAFVEIAGIVAVDGLFGRKMGELAQLSRSHIVRYQWFGLLVAAITIGLLFWLLMTHVEIGGPELSVARAQSRAMLINAYQFDYRVMVVGFLFAYALQWIRVNATLVFGGLLMGWDISLLLIAGGLSTYLVRNKERHYPFWSGVYAATSLWIFIKMLLK